MLTSDSLEDVRREAWAEGAKAGAENERAKWYRQGGNRAALRAMGFDPDVRPPSLPPNPYALTAAADLIARTEREHG